MIAGGKGCSNIYPVAPIRQHRFAEHDIWGGTQEPVAQEGNGRRLRV